MPHKKAKRSIREQERSKKGTDLAPTPIRGGDALSSEPLPKSFTRAINAAQVRADFRAKRKLAGEDDGEDGPTKKKRRKGDNEKAKGDTRIRPGETLAHFNKRIETDMRPLVRSAVQSSLATVRAQHKKGASASDPTTSTSTSSAPGSNSTASKANSKSGAKSKSSNSNLAPDDIDAPAPASIDKHASRPKEFAPRTSSSAPRRLNDIAQAPPELRKLKPNSTAKTANTGTHAKSSILSPAQALQMAAAREAAVAHYRALKAARRGADWNGGERGGGAVGEGEGDE
ncbi:hypothetical protein K438DRAFT_1572079 [Mycena galopus ATCC 62051]|nr:hypothetical protein K438DRAFT_1572079 [Mycena galopus ATCC 62051]